MIKENMKVLQSLECHPTFQKQINDSFENGGEEEKIAKIF